jgi:hypothetical protein
MEDKFMCDNCENQNMLEEEDLDGTVENNELTYFATPLIFDTENLAEDIKFDKDEFNKGIKKVSYDCGIFTALINSGMAYEDAFAYIIALKNIEMNIKLAEINGNATVEASKNQKAILENQQL